ncbi:MAG TPA: ABC transporter permease [Candidatus Thermoplasmatota archaeon]|nr:ABC transporter permease [Candidatus Thermoplasmatota archaeon]
MTTFLQGVFAVWRRELLVFRRESSRVVSSLVTPFMWLFLVGGGIGSAIDEAALFRGLNAVPAGLTYQQFIFPGIIGMSVLFGTVFYGLYIIQDRKFDVLKEVLVSPAPRVSIFVGKVVGGCTDAFVQAVLVLLIGLAIGFSFAGPAGVLLAMGFVVLIGVAFVSVGLTLGSFFESFEGFQVVISFLLFPAFFLSGALYPLGPDLPGWLHAVAVVNPLTYGVDGLRGALIGASRFPLWLDALVMGAFGIAMLAVGSRAFARMK